MISLSDGRMAIYGEPVPCLSKHGEAVVAVAPEDHVPLALALLETAPGSVRQEVVAWLVADSMRAHPAGKEAA